MTPLPTDRQGEFQASGEYTKKTRGKNKKNIYSDRRRGTTVTVTKEKQANVPFFVCVCVCVNRVVRTEKKTRARDLARLPAGGSLHASFTVRCRERPGETRFGENADSMQRGGGLGGHRGTDRGGPLV